MKSEINGINLIIITSSQQVKIFIPFLPQQSGMRDLCSFIKSINDNDFAWAVFLNFK